MGDAFRIKGSLLGHPVDVVVEECEGSEETPQPPAAAIDNPPAPPADAPAPPPPPAPPAPADAP